MSLDYVKSPSFLSVPLLDSEEFDSGKWKTNKKGYVKTQSLAMKFL